MAELGCRGLMTNQSGETLCCKRNKRKNSEGKMLYHCNL